MKVVHPSASIDLKTACFSFRCIAWVNSRVRRARGALAARGTRLKSVLGGSMTASMPPTVPQVARTPHQKVGWRPTESGSLHGRPRCCRLLRYGTCQARRENDKRSW
ncbi:Hypothetical protein XCAW_04109 [Xanthomonas citri subsp. citri Aw12879]|uniref:Uncharacterized protein n=1 Tax=Xanthomonas axonopodis pv. citri (strain 306) TaxID=190486 RepID=A0AAI7ZHP0_XANAC|nr:hypothetical protein XAC3416 [Xanthomonas citri pv. citri str. 306]AGI09874.1 Hypothetical protein XCAW_04109 [Xanthomonas citri subsp. citri Aw12879]